MSTLDEQLHRIIDGDDDWEPPSDDEAEAALEAAISDMIDWEDEDVAAEALYSRKGRKPLKEYLMRPSQLDRIPPVRWIIDGILPTDALAVLFAEPGAGKTFVALDWVGSLSAGLAEWEGCALRPDTRVLYILAEGAPGLRGRRDAWQGHHGLAWGDDGLAFIVRAANFMAVSKAWDADTEQSDFDQLRDIVTELRPNLLVVDTMSRAIPGVDENDAAPISLLMEKADQLRELGDHMTVLFLHHTNKAGRYRGSSVIHGQVDTMIEIDDDDILRVKKQKDGQEPVIGRVELLPVEGTDSVVPVYHSVVAEPDTETSKRATILAVLTAGPQTFSTLQKGIGGGKDQLKRLLAEMVEEGALSKSQVGQAHLYGLA